MKRTGTTISVPGKEYKAADRIIQKNDIITIDLSPQKNNIWGDYARTLVFEDGVLCSEIDRIKNDERLGFSWKPRTCRIFSLHAMHNYAIIMRKKGVKYYAADNAN